MQNAAGCTYVLYVLVQNCKHVHYIAIKEKLALQTSDSNSSVKESQQYVLAQRVKTQTNKQKRMNTLESNVLQLLCQNALTETFSHSLSTHQSSNTCFQDSLKLMFFTETTCETKIVKQKYAANKNQKTMRHRISLNQQESGELVQLSKPTLS